MRRIVTFGSYEFDLEARYVRKSGTPLKLRPQSIEVLAALVERAGEVVTRTELQIRLWPGVRYADFDNGLNSAVNRLRAALRDSAAKPRYIETIPGCGYRFVAPVSRSTGTVRRPRLAVLPFQNLSGDPSQEYLSDGLTEQVITTLAGPDPPRLGVIARTSVMHYKGSSKSVAEIGREMNLDYVVEGSVRREQDRANITARIIRVDDETHVWAHAYHEDLRTLPAFQDKVARAVAREIKSALPSDSRPDVNPAAWDRWLRGLHLYYRLDWAGLEEAIGLFREALDIEPSFARCWASLALASSAAVFWAHRSRAEMYEQAEFAALKGLAIDEKLTDAHSALVSVRWFLDWNLHDAERHVERALELGPGDPVALIHAASFFASMRSDFASGIAHAERALEVDPLSPLAHSQAGWPFYWAREYDRAIALACSALRIDPECITGRYVLGSAATAAGAFQQAIDVLSEAQRKHADTLSLAYLGMAYGRAGLRDKALDALHALEWKAERHYVPPTCLAWTWCSLGEIDNAFHSLEQAFSEHDPVVLWTRVSPIYDPLRGDPRFQPFLERLPLPPEHVNAFSTAGA